MVLKIRFYMGTCIETFQTVSSPNHKDITLKTDTQSCCVMDYEKNLLFMWCIMQSVFPDRNNPVLHISDGAITFGMKSQHQHLCPDVSVRHTQTSIVNLFMMSDSVSCANPEGYKSVQILPSSSSSVCLSVWTETEVWGYMIQLQCEDQ